MSIQMVGWVLDQEIKDPIAKLVLISMANAHNNTTGRCNPSYVVLANEASCDRRTAIRKVKWLAENGYIEVFEHKNGVVNGANCYRIIQEISSDRESLGDSGIESLGSVTPDTRGSDTGVTHKEPEIRTGNNIVHFEEFWEVFNHKKGKQAALKVWKRNNLSSKAKEIIEGARAYAKTRGSDARYWKHAQGWLNDGRWEDFTEESKGTSETNWQVILKAYREHSIWPPYLGPQPGMAGCRVPSEILEGEAA